MKKLFTQAVLSFCVLVLSTGIALASLTLGAAKQQGLVGERPDGFVGSVSAAPAPDVSALVDSVNAERLEKYQSIAAKNGTEVSQVQALAGKKLVEGAKPGEYILNAAGEWQQK